jgi:hypothetical protein
MSRSLFVIALFSVFIIVGLGCSRDRSPILPSNGPVLADEVRADKGRSPGTVLWGYYDVYIDIDSQRIVAVPNRCMMAAVNVVTFLNAQPSKLGFAFNGAHQGPGYVDVDLDVSITHPMSDKPQLNGYDVRGVFAGYGTGFMEYDWKLKYPRTGIDQFMLDDPVNADGGGPDGYTRWYNMKEFPVAGLFGYTKGVYATDLAMAAATLNPCRYFADGLGAHDDLEQFLNANQEDRGVFSSGTTNTRNYYIRFPKPDPGIKFGYAIVANWINGVTHPANAVEPVCCGVTVTPDVYYVSPSLNGGKLKLDVSLWDWDYQPSTIYVESTVLSSTYEFTSSDMTPIEQGDHYAKYHVEIPADDVTSTGGNEFWIIPENSFFGYICPLTPPGGAPAAPLAAFFRYDLYVSDTPYTNEPVCDFESVTPMPYVGDGLIEFDASGSYDPGGGDLAYHWDFDGDGLYDEIPDDDYDGLPSHPIHAYTEDYLGKVWLKVVGVGGESDCSIDIDVTIFGGITLYLYDGTVDDGGIVNWTGGSMDETWQYCPGIHAWDEDNCNPYTAGVHSTAMTPMIDFPETGHYESIHLEIWHWGDMQGDGLCFASLGTLQDIGGGKYGYVGNWFSESLEYVEGFDFNDIGWEEWSHTFGSEQDPEWSHFDCSAYADHSYAIGLEFSEWGAGNPNTQDGWSIRKLWLYYFPS